MKLFFTALLLFFIALQAHSQEMLGAANSNYAGTNGLLLNPSSMVDSRLKFDLNLLTVGFAVDNNYIYIPKDQLTFFGVKNSGNLQKGIGYTDEKNYDPNDLSRTYKGYGSTMARIPSAMFHIKDNYFALSITARNVSSADNIPAPLAKFAYEGGFQYGPLQGQPFSFNDMKTQTLTWIEIGVSYGHNIINQGTDVLNGAITMKRLLGYSSGYINTSATNVSAYQYNPTCDTCFGIKGDHAIIDYALPVAQGETSYNGSIAGHGWGFDIGLTYEYRPENEQHYYKMDGQTLIDPTHNQYKWKVGYSLIDLGKINFADAGVYHVEGDFNKTHYTEIKSSNPEDFSRNLSAMFYNGDSTASYVGNKYSMGLPHAMSIQVDYHIAKKWYANLTWMYAINSNNGPQARNLLSVAPRYEHKNVEVSMPVTLYDYNRLKFGLALRAYCLTIGSDRIGPLLGIADMDGVDAYVSLKIPIAKKRIKDRDHDEVSDMMDRCPDVKGPWEALGCPDRDGDGIADVDDSCPDLKGPPMFHGCPDTDGDGIPDRLDSCPTLAGLSQFHGCPDTDGDGITDLQDSCPTVAGLPQFHGCPDSDGDGIPDPLDSCPLTAGPASNHGCPVIKKEPVKVELNKEEQEVINKVFSNLEFETGKWVIRSSSFSSLDQLVALMKKKPTFKLLIDGHTDNVGSASSNLRLSQNRADAVKTYLVNKGIEADRITAKGYGLTRPVASNKTAEGRQKNRRVEFTIME